MSIITCEHSFHCRCSTINVWIKQISWRLATIICFLTFTVDFYDLFSVVVIAIVFFFLPSWQLTVIPSCERQTVAMQSKVDPSEIMHDQIDKCSKPIWSGRNECNKQKKTQQKCVIDFSFQRITSKWKKMRSLTSTNWKKSLKTPNWFVEYEIFPVIKFDLL